MYKVDQKPYDPRYVAQFAISIEALMNERAANGWVLMGTPMVSEKLAFAMLFWFKEDNDDIPNSITSPAVPTE